jgi:uncharacterized protein with NAD-binding domain and iron-sulfur cluster
MSAEAGSSERPIEVAIVGGGCAALTAAFELTRPALSGRYRVTVYQQGWRLGGKGASGRGSNDRIEEHGLHLWMGWYDNAFRLMRECYAELERDPATCRMADWQDAFKPDRYIGTLERKPGGGWQYWTAFFPAGDGLPGDPVPGGRFTLGHYLARSLALVRALLGTLQATRPEATPPEPEADPFGARDADWSRAGIGAFLARLSRLGEVATLAALIEGVSLIERVIGSRDRVPDNELVRLLEVVSRNARGQLEALARRDDESRRVWTIVDLTLTTMRGIVRHGLLDDPEGFDSIDEYDCREWLLLNGASQQTVHSSFINGLYDLVFAYEEGDPARPRIAAGQALRATIRSLFTYRGAYFWKMQAGMGDVVFAPLYEVLRRRGVRFEFFHRLENVVLAKPETLAPGDGPHVTALEFEVQARPKADPTTGRREYHPLIDVRGLPCWPAKPLYDRLEESEALRHRDLESFWDAGGLRKTLRVGEGFDIAVLAVGVGAIPFVCAELVATNPRWRAMVDHVKTVPTQAFQLWMRVDMQDLGWSGPAVNVTAFEEPFDSWADMRHLIPEESWAPGQTRALAYFCNSLRDELPIPGRAHTAYPAQQREQVRRNVVEFLNRDVVHLWPKAQRAPESFRWDVLVDAAEPVLEEGVATEKRLDSQYWTANVNPSDRYALSLPGSLKYRISPLDYDYDNLTVAGDWTACGFMAGCIEAAVMSGMLAAHAISGAPRLEEIHGYDHP